MGSPRRAAAAAAVAAAAAAAPVLLVLLLATPVVWGAHSSLRLRRLRPEPSSPAAAAFASPSSYSGINHAPLTAITPRAAKELLQHAFLYEFAGGAFEGGALVRACVRACGVWYACVRVSNRGDCWGSGGQAAVEATPL
jgi:hypothetical protein